MTQTTNDEIKALCVKADALATALSELIQHYKDTRYLASPTHEEQLAKATRKKKKKKPSGLLNNLVKRI